MFILPTESILTRAEVDAIVTKYNPRTVIPAHYYVAGLTNDVPDLEPAERWVNFQEKVHHADVRRLDKPELMLSAAELRRFIPKIYYSGSLHPSLLR